jgi:hypothetical protein
LAKDEIRLYLQEFYLFNSEEIAKVNVIVAVACTMVLISANICHGIIGYFRQPRAKKAHRAPMSAGGREMLTIGLLFLAVGGSIKYLLEVPYAFGWLDYGVPGSVAAFGYLAYGAVFFLTTWSWQYARRSFPLILALVLFEMTVGMLLFNKTEVLTVLIIFLIAFLRQKVTLARLGSITVIILFCFATIVPIVSDGRAELSRLKDEASLTQRLAILENVIENTENSEYTDPKNSAAVRLSYVNQASFAVRRYDTGQPGNSFVNILAVFIPRALWPEKPIITEVGNQFYAEATGNSQFSAASPGVFADCYWNFGWPGVILLMIPMGIVLLLLSRYSLDVVRRELWLYFPVVLMGMRIGFRTDGFFVVDIVGGTVILVSLHFVLKFADRFVFPLLRQPTIAAT